MKILNYKNIRSVIIRERSFIEMIHLFYNTIRIESYHRLYDEMYFCRL